VCKLIKYIENIINKVPDKMWAVIFNVVASILGWTSFGLGISSATTNHWRIIGPKDSILTTGLWFNCIGNLCHSIDNGEKRWDLIL